jgi:transmembrane 9 superfamily protein 3
MGKYEPPCRVNSIPRPVPAAAWYCTPSFLIPAAGILPFGSIFIEMYFIFTAFWSYKFYYVYGFMLVVYTILSLVTICTTIVAVYFLLNGMPFINSVSNGARNFDSSEIFEFSLFEP